ncbi:hypothetical protein TNCV_2292841 [Trichonephila clavipes]|nr:hypothetical protein TNCV_2292841 [Trichonephila clavipes]
MFHNEEISSGKKECALHRRKGLNGIVPEEHISLNVIKWSLTSPSSVMVKTTIESLCGGNMFRVTVQSYESKRSGVMVLGTCYLQQVNNLPWLVFSLSLSPIKNEWYAVVREVTTLPRNLLELRASVQVVGNELSLNWETYTIHCLGTRDLESGIMVIISLIERY